MVSMIELQSDRCLSYMMDNHANMLAVPDDMREKSNQHWEDRFGDGTTKSNFNFVDIEELSFRLRVNIRLDLDLSFVAHCLRDATGDSCRAHATPVTDSEQPGCVEPRSAYAVSAVGGTRYARSPVVASTKAEVTVLPPTLRASSAVPADFGQQYKRCNPGKYWFEKSMRESVTKRLSRTKVRRVKKRDSFAQGPSLLSSTFATATINIMKVSRGCPGMQDQSSDRTTKRLSHSPCFYPNLPVKIKKSFLTRDEQRMAEQGAEASKWQLR